jgi:hypothetical protein
MVGRTTECETLASFIFTSLDGFYEGPHGELDWPVVDQEFPRLCLPPARQGRHDWLRSRHVRAHGGVLADRAGHGERSRHDVSDERKGEACLLDDAHRREFGQGAPCSAARLQTTYQRSRLPPARNCLSSAAHISDRQLGAGRRPRRATRDGLPNHSRPGPIALRGSEESHLAHTPSCQAIRLWEPRTHLPTVAHPDISRP